MAKRKTQDQFELEVNEKGLGEYKVIGTYINAMTKVDIKHLNCGNTYNHCGFEFKSIPVKFLQGRGCPKCTESNGESEVRRVIEDISIPYEKEKKITGLVGVGGLPLRFDFAILNSNKVVKGLIEYDGEFHYKDYFKNNQHERTKAHDKIKNTYCEDNNIPLLRIPYWEFDNIEKLVTEFLHKIKEDK